MHSGNPAPVLDATTGKIILAYCRDNKQVFTIESSDEGANWGNVSNITEAVTEPDWHFVGTGPPGGIQLQSGRLIIGTNTARLQDIFLLAYLHLTCCSTDNL